MLTFDISQFLVLSSQTGTTFCHTSFDEKFIGIKSVVKRLYKKQSKKNQCVDRAGKSPRSSKHTQFAKKGISQPRAWATKTVIATAVQSDFLVMLIYGYKKWCLGDPIFIRDVRPQIKNVLTQFVQGVKCSSILLCVATFNFCAFGQSPQKCLKGDVHPPPTLKNPRFLS